MKRKPIDKTRNANSITESAFWGMIRSSLRRASRFWKPMSNAKKLARRKYIGTNPRQLWEFQCAKCNKWFKEKEVEVNHIQAVGSLKCADDLPGFVERLFAEEGYECVCKICHKSITEQQRLDNSQADA